MSAFQEWIVLGVFWTIFFALDYILADDEGEKEGVILSMETRNPGGHETVFKVRLQVGDEVVNAVYTGTSWLLDFEPGETLRFKACRNKFTKTLRSSYLMTSEKPRIPFRILLRQRRQ